MIGLFFYLFLAIPFGVAGDLPVIFYCGVISGIEIAIYIRELTPEKPKKKKKKRH